MTPFQILAAARERRAATAALPPYVTESAGRAGDATPVGNVWTSRLFDGPFHVTPPPADRPACSLVFVQSADGNTGAADPGALGGGETDKHLVYEGLSRVAADGVLAGAETARGPDVFFSVWHPELVALRASLGKARHPTQVVATLKGLDLDAALMFNVPEVPVVILAPAGAASRMEAAAAARPWITIVTTSGGAAGLPAALRQLRTLGIHTLSCVGGRTVARQLLDAGLVDDLYLTTTARPGGEPGTPLHTKAWRGDLVVRKCGTGPDAGVVFEHVHAPRVW